MVFIIGDVNGIRAWRKGSYGDVLMEGVLEVGEVARAGVDHAANLEACSRRNQSSDKYVGRHIFNKASTLKYFSCVYQKECKL